MFSGQPINVYGIALDTGQPYNKSIFGPSAPICLEFGSDIQLLNEDYPGKQGTYNFQIQVQGVNNTHLTTFNHNSTLSFYIMDQ
jgi:hypothetical protein